MSLSATGLVLPTQAQIIDSMVSDYEQLTGLTLDTARTDDQATMISISIASDRIAACYEALRGIYDGTNVDAAVGVQLQDASRLVGVDPDPAGYSTVTMSFLGTNGTVIPTGTIVEGGGDDGKARWVTTSDITIAGGSTTVVAQAQIAGPTVAAASSIVKIVTAVDGLNTVTNAAEATPGVLRETDSQLRKKRRASLTLQGSSSTSSILANLLALDYVEEAVVLQNADNGTRTISGKSMNSNSVWVFLNPTTLTETQKDDVAALLHKKVPAATQMMNSGGATATVKQVTDIGRSTSREISWDTGTDLPMFLEIVVVLTPGFVLADVTPGIEAALVDYFATLTMGATLSEYAMIQAVVLQGIEGLDTITIEAGILATWPFLQTLPYSPDTDKSLTLLASSIGIQV